MAMTQYKNNKTIADSFYKAKINKTAMNSYVNSVS